MPENRRFCGAAVARRSRVDFIGVSKRDPGQLKMRSFTIMKLVLGQSVKTPKTYRESVLVQFSGRGSDSLPIEDLQEKRHFVWGDEFV